MGLTPGKTIRVENLIPNEKHGFGRSGEGKSLLNLCRRKNVYPRTDPKQTLTLTLSLTLGLGLGLGLGLAWGHFQDKNFFVYTGFKDFSLYVYDDTNVLHFVSDSRRLSFSQELTPTLTLGLRLGLGLGLA